MATTFKKYLESKGLSKGSVASNEKSLYYFLNWCEIENQEPENTTHNDLIFYLKHLQKREVKQITAQKYIGALKHYFAWLISRKIIESNPAKNVDVKGVQRKQLYHILKKQELESLYENFVIPNEETDPNKNQNWFKAQVLTSKRNKAMLGLMLWQGLGTGELNNLQEKDLKLREGKIYVAGGRKSNDREMKLEATQILDLMEYTLQTRKELLALRKDDKELEALFVSNGTGKNRLHNAMSYLMKKLKEQNSNVSSAKQIRTSVITHWLKNYNLREVQFMAGHRYVSSTEAYLINDLDDLQEDVNKYHPF